MRKHIISACICILFVFDVFGQYDGGIVLSGGTHFSRYLGKGEGDNYFKFSKPGYQLEFIMNDGDGFEWLIYGVAYTKTYNYVNESKSLVEIWIPFYTEFTFYQSKKKNPLSVFFGYDYARMKFTDLEMEKPDNHHYITFGGGWDIKLAKSLYIRLKLKPYFVIGNTIGQWFGMSTMVNIRVCL